MFEPDVIAADHHGFRCEYTPTITDGPVFRWKRGDFEWLSASRNGVMIDTPRALALRGLDAFLKLIELARATHDRLAAGGFRGPDTDAVKRFLRDYKGE